MSKEFKLGIFVAAGIAAILVTIMMLGNYSLTSKYTVNTYFSDISGLPKKANVKISGVDVGKIKDVVLEGKRVKVVMVINDGIKLYSDAKARVVATGIIGTKYMDIDPGTPSGKPVVHGGTIEGESVKSSLEGIVSDTVKKVDTLLDNASKGLNEEFFRNLSDTVKNIKRLSQTIAAKEKALNNIIDNFNSFSSDMSEMARDTKGSVKDILEELKTVSSKMSAIIDKINTGDGTIATLINDKEMADNLKETVTEVKTTVEQLQAFTARANKLEIDWEYMGRYDSVYSRFRNDFGIRFRPNNHKFYYVGVSNISNYNNEENDFERKNMNKLDALLGFRSEKFEAYGGVMRNKGGIGAGFSPLDKIYAKNRKLYINAEALFRTESPDPQEQNPNTPNVIIGARLGIFSWLYVGVQVEDTLTKPDVMPYIKLKVTDEDLASLFGVATIAASGSK